MNTWLVQPTCGWRKHLAFDDIGDRETKHPAPMVPRIKISKSIGDTTGLYYSTKQIRHRYKRMS